MVAERALSAWAKRKYLGCFPNNRATLNDNDRLQTSIAERMRYESILSLDLTLIGKSLAEHRVQCLLKYHVNGWPA